MSVRKRAAEIKLGDIICGTTHRPAMRVDSIDDLGSEMIQRRRRSSQPNRVGAPIGEAQQVRRLAFRSKRSDGTTTLIVICHETSALKVVSV
jgi:hypothetical protein